MSVLAVLLCMLLLIIVTLLVTSVIRTRPRKGLPDGPKPRSLFTGNLSLTYGNSKFHLTLHELAQTYGNLYTLQMGWFPVVVISDFHTLKRAIITHGDVFNERPTHLPFLNMLYRGNGIIMRNGEAWKSLRKTLMTSIRYFGAKTDALETNMNLEVQLLLQEVNKHSGKPFKTEIMFHKAVSNILCYMLFGNRFDYDDQEYSSMLDGLEFVFSTGGFQNPYVFLPAFTFIAMPFTQHEVFKSIKHLRCIESFINNRIKEHRHAFDPSNLLDFVDLYLDAEKRNQNPSVFTEANLRKVLMDVLMAGTETVSQTLNWAMYFLVKYPHVQERCRNEVLKVLGQDEMVTAKHKTLMPYIKATISEVQRFSASTGVFHNTKQTINFDGHTISKDTIILTNFYSIHMDPRHWANPNEFCPERFLDESGNYQSDEFLVTFGLGKRICPGECIAKPEMFIFLISLLQRYRFSSNVEPDKLPKPKDANLGITLTTPVYEIMATPLW